MIKVAYSRNIYDLFLEVCATKKNTLAIPPCILFDGTLVDISLAIVSSYFAGVNDPVVSNTEHGYVRNVSNCLMNLLTEADLVNVDKNLEPKEGAKTVYLVFVILSEF